MRDTATHTGTLYVDGLAAATETNGDGRGVANPDRDLTIGDTGEEFGGLIDEVRVSDVARSPSFVAAQYLSMTDGFITYVAETGPMPFCPSG